MEPGTGFSLFAGWRHPAMNMSSMGMDLTQAAYRYNQNMMEYYTCKNSKLGFNQINQLENVLCFNCVST